MSKDKQSSNNPKVWLSSRKVDTRLPVHKALIVCNAKCTEVNYFKGAVKFLNGLNSSRTSIRQDVLKVRYHKSGVSPLQLVEEIKRKNKTKKSSINIDDYDTVWIVFDRDDNDDNQFEQAISKAEKLSNRNTKVFALYSIQSFELWLLLHFDYYNVATNRNYYFDKLKQKLGQAYNKTDNNIFDNLLQCACNSKQLEYTQDNIRDIISMAIANAQRLQQQYSPKIQQPLSSCDPITTVFKFFEYYFEELELIESV
ncbi:MAG: RloB family protein [Firmicutes bacterium]|nr:RloB family protein [Bacillota bacterium]MCL1944953.1 RloB family protein [Bacillota bacterium]MCL1954236.1 RloB family protein [Bacillota bacterium]